MESGKGRRRYPGNMSSSFASQRFKPSNAAKRLGVYLPATPQEFQDNPITRAELEELETNPPEWLAELRRNGPLTTQQINEIRDNPPAWLAQEREIAAQVRAEEERVEEARKAAEKKARSAR